jgi:hypothetical protein
VKRPGTEEVILFSREGDHIASSIENLEEALSTRSNVELPMWVDSGVYAHVSIAFESNRFVAETIYMDILEDLLKIRIAEELVAKFRNLSGKRMIMVDFVGDSLEYVDWVSFFTNETELLPEEIPTPTSPTLLGLNHARLPQLGSRFPSYYLERSNDAVIAGKHLSLRDFPAWRRTLYERLGLRQMIPPLRQE